MSSPTSNPIGPSSVSITGPDGATQQNDQMDRMTELTDKLLQVPKSELDERRQAKS